MTTTLFPDTLLSSITLMLDAKGVRVRLDRKTSSPYLTFSYPHQDGFWYGIRVDVEMEHKDNAIPVVCLYGTRRLKPCFRNFFLLMIRTPSLLTPQRNFEVHPMLVSDPPVEKFVENITHSSLSF